MQIDFEARRKISTQYFFRFLVKTLASSQTTRKRTDHFLRIDAGFCPKDQGLTDRSEIDGHDDLIRQFCKPTRAERTHMRNRFSESIEGGEGGLKFLGLPPCHDQKCGLDGSFSPAADRSINHGNANRRKIPGNLLRNDRVDRAHVDEKLAAFGAFFEAAG